jgi:hypothetical protein
MLTLFAAVTAAPASTTWYVNGVSGRDTNNCLSASTPCKTIKHAILQAASGDAIMVASATYKENLSIGINVKVIGSGARTTIIDGGGVGQVFYISSGANVSLSGMTIRHGLKAFYGGGIENLGILILSNSTVSGNIAHVGGGLYNESGAKMRITNSTISGNAADVLCRYPPCFIYGGGIYNGPLGKLTISNCTISGNRARLGSAIYNIQGTVMISNATISGNLGNNGLAADTVFADGGVLTLSNTTVAGNHGAGVDLEKDFGSGRVPLQNSVIANNFDSNCTGVTSNGYNLSSDDSCNFNRSGGMDNTDPLLGPLQNNGGPTFTQALLPGSPAIDAGNPSGCTDSQGHVLKTDQRGMPRPDKDDSGGCDMGAYERQSE